VTETDSIALPATGAPGVGLGSSAGKAIIAAAVLGSALAYMSDDMLNVALPTVSRDLSVGVTEMQWVVNSYFVTMLSLMLTAGSIGDIKGHRKMFLGGLGVFSAGAIMSATAPSVPLLIAGRAIQGVGAAFLLASGLALVNGSFSDDERGRAVGTYMGLTAVSTAVGPVLGGLLVDVLSWRAIFVAPLVFPLAAVVVTLRRVPETPIVGGRHPDARGAGLAFLTIASFSFALIRGPGDWLRPEIVTAVVLAAVGGVVFLRAQRRSRDPMMPLHLFRSRTFSGGNAVTLLAYLVSAGVFLFVVVHLQSTLGYEPAAAGAALMPLYVIMLIGSPLAGKLADKIGARTPVVAGLLILAGGVYWLSHLQSGSRFLTAVLPGLVVFAVGLAIAGAPLTTATLGAAGADEQGVASGVNNTVGQLSGLLMIAILPTAAGLSGGKLEGPAFAAGYETAMLICVLLALAAAAVAAVTISADRHGESN
jgi:EmrB/QacA subfamily drug resistance transporter